MITDRSHAPTRCCSRTGIHLTPGALCSAPSLKRGPRNVRTGECCLAKPPHAGFRGVCGVSCAPPKIDAASLCNSIETSCYCNLLFRREKTPQNPVNPAQIQPPSLLLATRQNNAQQCRAMRCQAVSGSDRRLVRVDHPELHSIAVIAGLYQTQPINRAPQIGGQPLAKPPAINRPPVTGH